MADSYVCSAPMRCNRLTCERTMNEELKRGRPATKRGAYNPNPARQFGRISDEDWNELKAACDLAGLSMVEWALPTLLKKARREKRHRAK